jgi:hypothetical protein
MRRLDASGCERAIGLTSLLKPTNNYLPRVSPIPVIILHRPRAVHPETTRPLVTDETPKIVHDRLQHMPGVRTGSVSNP